MRLYSPSRRLISAIFIGSLLIISSLVAGIYFYQRSQPAKTIYIVTDESQIPENIMISPEIFSDGEDTVSDTYIVAFKPDASEVQIQEYATSNNARIIAQFTDLHAVTLGLPEGKTPSESDIVAEIAADKYIPLLQAEAPTAPNDPYFPFQAGLASMKFGNIWQYPRDAFAPSEITVAVIDTGACFDHPDLAGRWLTTGYDYANNDGDPTDDQGHGCAVGGVIAAISDNQVGISGAATNVKLIPYKVMGANGQGTLTAVVQGIMAATASNATILNLSLGSNTDAMLLRSAIGWALAHSKIVVAAAGNSGNSTPIYPAAYSGVIAVGAVDNAGARATFSNFGDYVSAWAPGQNILTTHLGQGYAIRSGTSFSAPYYAGALAAAQGYKRNLVAPSGIASIEYPVLANTKPTITSSSSLANGTVGSALTQQLEASDPEGDRIRFTISEPIPAGLSVSDSGLISWPAPTAGQYTLQISVGDWGGFNTPQAFSLNIAARPVSSPPAAASISYCDANGIPGSSGTIKMVPGSFYVVSVPMGSPPTAKSCGSNGSLSSMAVPSYYYNVGMYGCSGKCAGHSQNATYPEGYKCNLVSPQTGCRRCVRTGGTTTFNTYAWETASGC